ncbi:nucleoside triphosphate pyrophosphohydrolase family protein [Cuniculiplasma sp. SKW3]|uniref:nucleoside triphosphate pyrophosphohydrolase family protein n=1 Tax=Cuniculiplasma sp. SKW3 TaxID=3400170 RepID=UPI003FD2CA4E
MTQESLNSFEKYEEQQKRTAGPRSNLINAALGLCGESGEVADLIKKVEFQGHSFNRDKIIEELGDILWYLSEAARAINSNLSEIAQANIDKLKKRYPKGFSEERSIFRDQ